MPVRLRNKLGNAITIARGEWEILLNIARDHGWIPQGTMPDIDALKKRFRNPDDGYDENAVRKAIDEWDGSYSISEGVVTYADSLNLSFALEDTGSHGHRGIEDLIAFCREGGFIIS